MKQTTRFKIKKAFLFLLSLSLFSVFVWAAMFAYYAHIINDYKSIQLQKSSAIIVLTGDSFRISYGIELLKQGYAPNLFITGVHNKYDDTFIKEDSPCCIEVGSQAINTIGNAIEAGFWLKRNKIDNFILVTSDYHMPRSVNVFERILGEDIDIQTAVVKTNQTPMTMRRAKVITKEFVKYILQRMIPLQFMRDRSF
tara:strand:+ start:671 stop:1261 length:591 start_codon:yes stop_codon:yes gene_type:complete